MRFSPVPLALAAAVSLPLACFALSASAETPVLERAAQAAMSVCAQVWTARTEAELDAIVADRKAEFEMTIETAENRIAKAVLAIAEQKKRVASLNAAWEAKLATTVEEAAKAYGGAGWENALQIAKAASAYGGDEAANAELKAARAELEQLQAYLSRLRLTYAALASTRVIIEGCMREQRNYLRGAANPPPPPPPPPPGGAGDFSAAYAFDICYGGWDSWSTRHGRLAFSQGAAEGPPGWYRASGAFDWEGGKIPLDGRIMDREGTIESGFDLEGESGGIKVVVTGTMNRGPGGKFVLTLGQVQVLSASGNGDSCMGTMAP